MRRERTPETCDVPFFHALICTRCEYLTACQKKVDMEMKRNGL